MADTVEEIKKRIEAIQARIEAKEAKIAEHRRADAIAAEVASAKFAEERLLEEEARVDAELATLEGASTTTTVAPPPPPSPEPPASDDARKGDK